MHRVLELFLEAKHKVLFGGKVSAVGSPFAGHVAILLCGYQLDPCIKKAMFLLRCRCYCQYLYLPPLSASRFTKELYSLARLRGGVWSFHSSSSRLRILLTPAVLKEMQNPVTKVSGMRITSSCRRSHMGV